MLPHTFLRPYTQHLGIPGIRTFFLVYAVAAFSVRIVTRQLTDRLGVRPVIQLGLATMALSMLAYVAVRSEPWLALPAALGGFAHAFLFPAVVTGGSLSFPSRYRGLATTLVLSMFDVANLVCQPLIGGIVEYAPRVLGLPSYATMFVAMAGLMIAGVVAAFAIEDRSTGSR
jgi:MFS family permease